MIRGLILYYLNIKSTHGYEIQRFIQLSGIDQWVTIQSGSIYYALSKLEKEGNVTVVREERVGARVRKIYAITEKGRDTMKLEMKKELSTPISEVGSMKMIIEPIIGALSTDEIRPIIKNHISQLEKKLSYWKEWKEVKAGDDANNLTRLSFEMTIHTIEDQILWHKELAENLDYYKGESKTISQLILAFEPDRVEVHSDDNKNIQEKLDFIEEIKDKLQDDPDLAIESLNKMIEQIKKMDHKTK